MKTTLLTPWQRWAAPAALGLLLAGPALAQSKQPAPIRFGQPDPADFEAKNFVADSGAAAVVLCDYGTTRFGSPTGEMRIMHDRVVRLKILKKAGYDYATVEVPLYHREGDAEKLSNLRGFTYVRGADGKMVKTKLEAANVFGEKRTDRVDIQKFTLPAVQEGAVVEYAYTVTSSFLSDCPDWTFQRDIPTRWSEYRTSLPRLYRYKFLYHGYQPLAVNEEGAGSVQLSLTRHVGPGGSLDGGTSNVGVNTEDHRWVVRDAPPVRAEPYITTATDYLARMDCELAGTQWPDEPYRDLTETWAKMNDLLRRHEEFGQVLARADFLQPAVQPLVLRYPDPAARAAAVRELVLQTVKYDDAPRLFTGTALKRTWEQHRGTSADVNLLLIAALRQAGLAAQPVILSTRAHGKVTQEYPQLDQFNYVLALVELPESKELLLDATEPLLPAGVLPPHCLTSLGHTVPAQGEGRWVNLSPGTSYVHFQDVKMTLDAQGNLSSQVREEYGGYGGLEAREKLAGLGEKKYVAELASQHPSCEVPSYTFSGTASCAQPLGLAYTLRQTATTPGAAQELFVSPLAVFGEGRNPFRLATRSFPVDFGMAQQETISLTLTLPPGYVAELPKPAALALPGQGGRYVYAASSPTPGTVQLISRLTLDKAVYSPEEYHALRELYRQMLAKQAEALVVKKAG
ncbi:MAG: transglutaminase domain-containing protein [Janthinobacterium lividum]